MGTASTPSWGILNWVGSFVAATQLPMKSTKETNDYAHFLQELREARREAGLSQEQLAEALGQRQTFVSKGELGDRRLDVIELRSWVIALGGDPVAFMASLEDRLARNALPQVDRPPSKGRRKG
jgi:DNA-binding XRE family transcriptional regulator